MFKRVDFAWREIEFVVQKIRLGKTTDILHHIRDYTK